MWAKDEDEWEEELENEKSATNSLGEQKDSESEDSEEEVKSLAQKPNEGRKEEKLA